MLKKWFSLACLLISTAIAQASSVCPTWAEANTSEPYSITIMSYNVDTPEKDTGDWNKWRKDAVVDVMTEFSLKDFYGLQETKNHGGPQICEQLRDIINTRPAVQTAGKHYDFISIQNLPKNPGQDCENSIFFDSTQWKCLSSDGLWVWQDWDPRYAFYGVFQNIQQPQQTLIVFNTHAPAGNFKGSHNGFLPQDFVNIANYITATRKKVSADHPENVPVVFSGDWNGNVQGQKDLQNIGLETCRIKAGHQGDTGPTWPSTNPGDAFDQILAGQSGMDWASSSVSVLGRGQANVEKASDHLPIEAELHFLSVPQ